MNNDTEFLVVAEEEMTVLENWLESACDDVDCLRSGNVLTIELENGEQIVVNIQTPMHEIWCASRFGGFHFGCKDGQWIENGTGRPLKQAVVDAITGFGVDIDVNP